MNTEERILQAQKAAIPMRLRRGAEVLGRLWKENQRCLSTWSRICACTYPTDFCDAKKKWVALCDELYGGPPFGLAGYEPFYVIEAMTVSQFHATKLTATVEAPGGQRIKIGIRGTTWKTLVDLAAIQEDDVALAVGIDAVVKLQKAAGL